MSKTMGFIDRKVDLGSHVAQVGLIESWFWSKAALTEKNTCFIDRKVDLKEVDTAKSSPNWPRSMAGLDRGGAFWPKRGDSGSDRGLDLAQGRSDREKPWFSWCQRGQHSQVRTFSLREHPVEIYI